MVRPDKEQSRRIRSEIDRVLWEIWDPIGVNDESAARDEYRGYIGEIYELLISAADDQEIRKYLNFVSEVQMGMGKGEEVETIAALRSIPLDS